MSAVQLERVRKKETAAWHSPGGPVKVELSVRALSPVPDSCTEALSSGKRRRGRPTSQEAEELCNDILNAALKSFMERGFEASSMDGIARDAGVARMTLYRHFESKEEMFVQVTRRAQLRVRARLERPIDMSRPLEQVLRDIIGMLYDGFTQPDYIAVYRMVAAESARFPKLGRAMLNDMKHFSEPLVRYLGELQRMGRIEISTPLEAAIQISGMASGSGRYLLVRPSGHPVSRLHWVDSLTDLFSRAWRPIGPRH